MTRWKTLPAHLHVVSVALLSKPGARLAFLTLVMALAAWAQDPFSSLGTSAQTFSTGTYYPLPSGKAEFRGFRDGNAYLPVHQPDSDAAGDRPQAMHCHSDRHVSSLSPLYRFVSVGCFRSLVERSVLADKTRSRIGCNRSESSRPTGMCLTQAKQLTKRRPGAKADELFRSRLVILFSRRSLNPLQDAAHAPTKSPCCNSSITPIFETKLGDLGTLLSFSGIDPDCQTDEAVNAFTRRSESAMRLFDDPLFPYLFLYRQALRRDREPSGILHSCGDRSGASSG